MHQSPHPEVRAEASARSRRIAGEALPVTARASDEVLDYRSRTRARASMGELRLYLHVRGQAATGRRLRRAETISTSASTSIRPGRSAATAPAGPCTRFTRALRTRSTDWLISHADGDGDQVLVPVPRRKLDPGRVGSLTLARQAARWTGQESSRRITIATQVRVIPRRVRASRLGLTASHLSMRSLRCDRETPVPSC